MSFLFKVEAGPDIGIGHLKRMINLGNQLNVKKKNITWFIKGSKEIAKSIFNKNNFYYLYIHKFHHLFTKVSMNFMIVYANIYN